MSVNIDTRQVQFTETEVLRMLQDQIHAAGSQKAWAEKHDISQVYVSATLTGKHKPAGKVLAAMELVVLPRMFTWAEKTSNGDETEGGA